MDGQTVNNNSMDTSSAPQPLAPELPINFASIVVSPHADAALHSDVSILSNPSSHLMHELPSAFPNEAHQPNGMPASIHVPIADLSVPSLDILNSSSTVRAQPPRFIPDFPRDAFEIGATELDNDMGMDSSPGLSSASNVQVSPSIHTATPGYSQGTSSLASALDTMGLSVGRSRAGSPGTLMNSRLGYPPGGNIPLIDANGVPFPPSDLNNGRPEISPERTGPPLMAVGDILEGIAKTAHSAQEAYTMGQCVEAGVKIDELKRAISWVSELIAKIDGPMSLTDASSPTYLSNFSPPPAISGVARISPEQHSPGYDTSSAAVIDASAMVDVQSHLDVSDGSRKRCASSMAGEVGDRVMKAPKMEPQEDVLVIPPSTTNSQPPQLFSNPGMPLTSLSSSIRSVPTSAPPSRPPTPGSLMSQQTLALLQQHPAPSLKYSHVLASAPPPADFGPIPSQPGPPLGPRNRSSWSDTSPTFPQRQHQHSLSLGGLNGNANTHNSPTTGLSFSATGSFGTPSLNSPTKQRPGANGGTTISPPLGRIARSGSVTGVPNPFSFGFTEVPTLDPYDFRPTRSSAVPAAHSLSPDSEDDDGDDDEGGAEGSTQSSKNSASGSSLENGASVHGNEVPLEYRAEVDRIFFEFLNRICSNLDAADSKGEPIHQTLMAKKMQRLDESPDFRPFKFRIAAFTNAFLEELSRQGYPEEKIPMKKIRNYLWRQVYIQRFNEDGKKAKSKGNHIWNIDAKKGRDGGWIFRPFHRRLAGSPPGIAYIGLRWSWTPRIWDPQASSSNLPVQYNSPSLPSWLIWKDDVLSGIPPPDAESCDITVEAKFMRDGQEEQLTSVFHLNIAPISTLDSSFSTSRRPSLAGDPQHPRRVASDSVVPQATPRSLRQGTQSALGPPSPSQGAQVMQVLTSAAQRVAQEAQSQVIALTPSSEPPGPELQALVKQQHVLTMTAVAFDKEYTGQRQEGTSQSTNSVLAVAAQQVVLQAARSVRADRSAAAVTAGNPPSQSAAAQQVTVNEVSVATQSAVAQAVEITGPLSSEVDVLMTASSLLQQQARTPVSLSDSSQVVPLEPTRPHSTGALVGHAYPFSPSFSKHGLSDYVQL